MMLKLITYSNKIEYVNIINCYIFIGTYMSTFIFDCMCQQEQQLSHQMSPRLYTSVTMSLSDNGGREREWCVWIVTLYACQGGVGVGVGVYIPQDSGSAIIIGFHVPS